MLHTQPVNAVLDIFALYYENCTIYITRDGPEDVGAPGYLIVWCRSKWYSSNIFYPKTALANIFEGACPNADNLGRSSFACRKPEFTRNRFPIIPLKSRRPGQMSGWTAGYSVPVLYLHCGGRYAIAQCQLSWYIQLLLYQNDFSFIIPIRFHLRWEKQMKLWGFRFLAVPYSSEQRGE